jgi:hypothetical protein
MPVRGPSGVLVKRFAPLAVMPAAAFAVHQLRYWLAFGGRAAATLQAQGHSYLHSLVPWLVLLIALAVGCFLRSLGRAFAGECSLPRYTVSFAVLWMLCAAGLVAIFALQESLEGLLVTGHPAGLVGIFGYGGWWAVPASLAVGLVLAALFHGARFVLGEVAERYRRHGHVSRRLRVVARAPRVLLLPSPIPLADGWSDRGPPR